MKSRGLMSFGDFCSKEGIELFDRNFFNRRFFPFLIQLFLPFPEWMDRFGGGSIGEPNAALEIIKSVNARDIADMETGKDA